MAMFPPAVPHVFIQWLTNPGEAVYDPFSGRGTTVLEACALGRVGLGSDANPLAWVLSSAKADPPTHLAISQRLRELRSGRADVGVSQERAEIRSVFDPDVLSQLLWLRSQLSLGSKVDRFLYAVLLGVLHANAATDGSPRGLTIAMPNTFSMAPNYVMNYKRIHGLRAPKRDVLDFIERRISQLGSLPSSFCKGKAWRSDATKVSSMPSVETPVRLIFTSPPYLSVMKYGKLNWLRLWLLGYEPKEVDSRLFASESLERYLAFMTAAISKMAAILALNGRACLVIGDVTRKGETIKLAEAVAETCVHGSGLRVDALIEDELPFAHKVSRIWKDRRGQATKTDRILILSKFRAGSLPRLPQIDWSSTARRVP